MKVLLQILVGGTVLFLAIAIAQEWSLFGQAWFGEPAAAPTLAEAEQKEAADTVHRLLTLMEHLYGTGGDPRFAERLPASATVIEEIQADVDYLRRNRRRQEMSLDRLEVTAIEARGPDRVEVETRETWSVRVVWRQGEDAAEVGHRRRVYGTYRLSRDERGWQVVGWEPSVPWRTQEAPEASD